MFTKKYKSYSWNKIGNHVILTHEEGVIMAIRNKLIQDDRDDLTKDVDDLDAVYLEKLKKDGIDEDLLTQFKELTIQLEKDKKDE